MDSDTNPFRYCGEYFDEETDNIYLRNRYYNPAIGAFITEDPIRDGVNWYSYCGGNPVRYVDPSGETQREDGKYNVETQKKILRYSIEYNEAKAKGDKKGMQEAARKAKNLRVKENEAGFLKDGVAPANWDLATQAAFAGANTAVEAGYFEASSLEYGEFITEFISQFGEKYNEIDAAYDATMASLLIAQISSNMQQCFTEETLVLTQTGYKKIKEVKEGDYVLSENSDTGKKGYKKVVRKFENETNALVHILVDDIEISATESHPFYVCSKGWVCAGDLRIGDKLTTGNSGYVVISSIYKEDLDYSIKVYNLEIEDWHTYFVSENMVLVHNMCMLNQPKTPVHVKDNYLKKNGIDPHQLKKDYLGEKAPLSKYDIYEDKSDGRLWIYRHGGQGNAMPTNEYIPKS